MFNYCFIYGIILIPMGIGGKHMLKANYHTHTKLCNHAVGMPEDYIKKAIELGFDELGMSDHAPVPREFMSEEEYIYDSKKYDIR